MKWIKVSSLILALACMLTGCDITKSGRAYDLIDDNQYAQALPDIEASAKDGSKLSAVIAGFMYLSDYQIPTNLDKAKYYYKLALKTHYGRYDQALDYFIPQLKARILLYDDKTSNDKEATSILRGDRYSQYPPSLVLLAKCYAFGKGVKANYDIAHGLFERAVEDDNDVGSAHIYAWYLAVHPDPRFRNGKKAMTLMQSVMDDADEAKRSGTLDTLAAVYAENGDFTQAVSTQKKALSKLKQDTRHYPMFACWRPAFEARLDSYEQGKAWHLTRQDHVFSYAGNSHCEHR